MRKTFLFIVFFLKLAGVSYGQDKESCDCSIVLKEVISDIENKYPGFKVKTDRDRISYGKLKKYTLTKAVKVTDREECFYLIEKYIGFFKDNHIIFTDRKSEPKQVIATKLDQDLMRQTDRLTGIWKKEGDSLTIKISRAYNKDHALLYRAFVQYASNGNFKKGNVYFDLIGSENEFRIRKYNNALTTDLLRGRRLKNLLIEPNGIWKKVDAQTRDVPFIRSEYARNSRFLYRPINNNVYYIAIPSFNTDPKKFDSLVLQKMIPEMSNGKIKHLIIDLRNNVGGNSSFFSLLRMIYEKPFAVPGDFVFSTPDMIKRYQGSDNPAHQEMLPKLIENPGGFVQRDSLTIRSKDVYPYPERISIIVNENCASSTEYFLILAKHSKKVKIYGRHTAGTLDYSELLGPEKLSCTGYSYMRPTTKSFWTDTSPIDNKGIKPDVDLSRFTDDEWVDLVMKIPVPFQIN